ncbi:hypothetical protein B0H16DRAFT_1686189 [Mycena metata]|uniref:Uncharacterized protein n=1 Tax=Mycena metata TaxID=1033252 RepID=A0AAD7JPQ9_9AGAR|nr:hypothetical protein B0H16DRAFT_1686189 [Mycena metata]
MLLQVDETRAETGIREDRGCERSIEDLATIPQTHHRKSAWNSQRNKKTTYGGVEKTGSSNSSKPVRPLPHDFGLTGRSNVGLREAGLRTSLVTEHGFLAVRVGVTERRDVEGTGLAGKRTPLGATNKGSRGWAAAGLTMAAGVDTADTASGGNGRDWQPGEDCRRRGRPDVRVTAAVGMGGGKVGVVCERAGDGSERARGEVSGGGRTCGRGMGAGRGEAAQQACWVRDVDGGMRPAVRTSRGGGAAVWAGVDFGGGRCGDAGAPTYSGCLLLTAGCGQERSSWGAVLVVVWEERVGAEVAGWWRLGLGGASFPT